MEALEKGEWPVDYDVFLFDAVVHYVVAGSLDTYLIQNLLETLFLGYLMVNYCPVQVLVLYRRLEHLHECLVYRLNLDISVNLLVA